jgi:predicted DNA-binding transcriptional regulator YafY
MRGAGKAFLVKLEFSPEVARFVRERRWHPSQKQKTLANDSLIMTFRVTHLLEIQRWVLSFGSGVRVLEPVELQKALTEEAEKLMKQYPNA